MHYRRGAHIASYMHAVAAVVVLMDLNYKCCIINCYMMLIEPFIGYRTTYSYQFDSLYTLLKLLCCFNTQMGQIWYHLSVFLCFSL